MNPNRFYAIEAAAALSDSDSQEELSSDDSNLYQLLTAQQTNTVDLILRMCLLVPIMIAMMIKAILYQAYNLMLVKLA